MNYYHGTIAGNSDFDKLRDKASHLNRDGAVIYLTSDISDAVGNYASPYSHDNRGKLHVMLDSGELTQSFPDALETIYKHHTPKVLTCTVKMDRPFIASDKPLAPSSDYYNLAHSIQSFLVEREIFGQQNDNITERLLTDIKKCKTSTEILSYLRYKANDAAYCASKESHEKIGKDISFSTCLFGRFDAIIDKSAGDLWYTKKGAHHVILKNNEQVKVGKVTDITPAEAEIIKAYHTQTADPKKNPDPFDCHTQLGWKTENASVYDPAF